MTCDNFALSCRNPTAYGASDTGYSSTYETGAGVHIHLQKVCSIKQLDEMM